MQFNSGNSLLLEPVHLRFVGTLLGVLHDCQRLGQYSEPLFGLAYFRMGARLRGAPRRAWPLAGAGARVALHATRASSRPHRCESRSR